VATEGECRALQEELAVQRLWIYEVLVLSIVPDGMEVWLTLWVELQDV
jgi:hypothetical protein